MSGYKDLFNINQITDLETLNATEGTINSLTSDNFKSQSSEIDNGEFKTILVNNLNVTNDLNVKNIKLNSNSVISKGDYVYTLQDKTGIIAHLDDIKMPDNMVTTDTEQTITGKKTFTKNIVLNDGILSNNKKITFQDKSGVVSLTSDLDRYVTTDTYQIIYAEKLFNNYVRFNSRIKNSGGRFIELPSVEGQLVVKSELKNYVGTSTNQTINGIKTFNDRLFCLDGISNGVNNYVLPDKDGELVVDDDLKNMVVVDDLKNYVTLDSIQTISNNKTFTAPVIFDNVITLKDSVSCWSNMTVSKDLTVSGDLRLQLDGRITKLGYHFFTLPNKDGELVISDDIKDMVVKDELKDVNDKIDTINNELKNVATKDEVEEALEDYVNLNDNQIISGDKQFNKIYCFDKLDFTGRNCKKVGWFYEWDPNLSCFLNLDFTPNYSFMCSGKVIVTGYVDMNRSKVFYIEYFILAGRNGPYGDYNTIEVVSNKNNIGSIHPNMNFESISNNFIKYRILTSNGASKTTMLINCDINYFSDIPGNLNIKFEEGTTI